MAPRRGARPSLRSLTGRGAGAWGSNTPVTELSAMASPAVKGAAKAVDAAAPGFDAAATGFDAAATGFDAAATGFDVRDARILPRTSATSGADWTPRA